MGQVGLKAFGIDRRVDDVNLPGGIPERLQETRGVVAVRDERSRSTRREAQSVEQFLPWRFDRLLQRHQHRRRRIRVIRLGASPDNLRAERKPAMTESSSLRAAK